MQQNIRKLLVKEEQTYTYLWLPIMEQVDYGIIIDKRELMFLKLVRGQMDI